MTANGLQFTVTGLSSATNYAFNLTVKDAQEMVIASYSGEFTTTGVATAVENTLNSDTPCTKVLKDGQLLILRGDNTYTTDGRLVR